MLCPGILFYLGGERLEFLLCNSQAEQHLVWVLCSLHHGVELDNIVAATLCDLVRSLSDFFPQHSHRSLQIVLYLSPLELSRQAHEAEYDSYSREPEMTQGQSYSHTDLIIG